MSLTDAKGNNTGSETCHTNLASDITYRHNYPLSPRAVADLFRAAPLNGPLDDLERMRTMLESSQLLISAWHGDRLIGVARTLTDFSFNAFIADLAVHPDY